MWQADGTGTDAYYITRIGFDIVLPTSDRLKDDSLSVHFSRNREVSG